MGWDAKVALGMEQKAVADAIPALLSPDSAPLSAVSHSYGYGLLDAGAMVALAKNWTSVGPQRKCIIDILPEPKWVSEGGWAWKRLSSPSWVGAQLFEYGVLDLQPYVK